MSAPARRAFSSSSSAAPSLLDRLVTKAREVVTGQTLVGRDAHGNAYYTWVDRGTGAERRRVVVSGGDHLYDPNRLPPPWRAWLQKTREDAPTQEEGERAEERARVMRARVAAIEERERQRRMAREFGGGGGGPAGGGGGGGMARMLEDMRRADKEEDGERPGAGGGGGGASGGGGGASGGGGGQRR